MELLFLYLVICYLIACGTVIEGKKNKVNKQISGEDIVILLLSPILIPIALGALLESKSK